MLKLDCNLFCAFRFFIRIKDQYFTVTLVKPKSRTLRPIRDKVQLYLRIWSCFSSNRNWNIVMIQACGMNCRCRERKYKKHYSIRMYVQVEKHIPQLVSDWVLQRCYIGHKEGLYRSFSWADFSLIKEYILFNRPLQDTLFFVVFKLVSI